MRILERQRPLRASLSRRRHDHRRRSTRCECGLPAAPTCRIRHRSVTPVYVAAFGETIEYFGYSREQIAGAARRDLTHYFAGEHGQPTSASCLAMASEPNPDEEIFAGAAMVTLTANGPLLYLLFVAPQWHRRGLATAMVSAAINELHELGEKGAHQQISHRQRTEHGLASELRFRRTT